MLTGKTKKIACIVLVIAMAGMTAACSTSSNAASTNLTGTAEDVLNNLLDQLAAENVEMPMALPPMSAAPDLTQDTYGLSQADYERLVDNASYSLAAIGTFAHQIIVLQAKDAASAVEVKNLVSGDGGYDPHKWICVFPDKAAAVNSGEYVLIVASHTNVVDAALADFQEQAGNVGDVIAFWEFADNGAVGGGDLGMITPLSLEIEVND